MSVKVLGALPCLIKTAFPLKQPAPAFTCTRPLYAKQPITGGYRGEGETSVSHGVDVWHCAADPRRKDGLIIPSEKTATRSGGERPGKRELIYTLKFVLFRLFCAWIGGSGAPQ